MTPTPSEPVSTWSSGALSAPRPHGPRWPVRVARRILRATAAVAKRLLRAVLSLSGPSAAVGAAGALVLSVSPISLAPPRASKVTHQRRRDDVAA